MKVEKHKKIGRSTQEVPCPINRIPDKRTAKTVEGRTPETMPENFSETNDLQGEFSSSAVLIPQIKIQELKRINVT